MKTWHTKFCGMRDLTSKTSFTLVAIVVVILMAPASDGLMTESYVRMQLDPDTGGRIVTLVDFERIVNFVFDSDNKILNCQVAKRNEMGRKMIILEVIILYIRHGTYALNENFIHKVLLSGARHDRRNKRAVLSAGGGCCLVRAKVLQVPQK